MPSTVLTILTLIALTLTSAWAMRASSNRPRYRPDGYRMIRRQRKSSTVFASAFGIGASGGLMIVLFGLIVMG